MSTGARRHMPIASSGAQNQASFPFRRPPSSVVINLKTARALGLDVPQSLLATANDVIE